VKVNRLNEEEILVIEEEMAERSEEIKVILEQSDKYSVEESDSVRILSDILADLKTHKYIEDTELGTMRESKIDDIEDSISRLYQHEITDFVATSPQELNDFINNSLMSINNYVTQSVSKEDIDLEIRDFLVDVSEAIEANDIQRALYYVGEAEQTIEFNEEVDSMQPSNETK
jgi:hypothetical protein